MRLIKLFSMVLLVIPLALISVTALSGRRATKAPPQLQSLSERRATQEIVVSYTPVASPASLHEPVSVEFTMHNNSSSAIKLDLGPDRKGNFVLDVVEPDGRKVHSVFEKDGISMVGKISVGSHESYVQKLLLNEWFALSKVGKYQVEITLTSAVLGVDGNSLAVGTRGHVSIEVTQKDIEQLSRVCAMLLDRILKAPSYADATAAASELSYVDDPIAIRPLEKALTGGRMVEKIAIAGLERIGNREAVEVLISVLTRREVDIAPLARSALSRIDQSSRDPFIRARIRGVL